MVKQVSSVLQYFVFLVGEGKVMGSVGSIIFCLWGDLLVGIRERFVPLAQTLFFQRGPEVFVVGNGHNSTLTLTEFGCMWSGSGP